MPVAAKPVRRQMNSIKTHATILGIPGFVSSIVLVRMARETFPPYAVSSGPYPPLACRYRSYNNFPCLYRPAAFRNAPPVIFFLMDTLSCQSLPMSQNLRVT
jgi:hypothetical protein